MELWIRSQNKDRLLKANAIIIASFNDLIAIHGYIDNNTHVWLGNYKSKERALEVLDEIQDLMRSLTDSNLKIIQYEMPKD